jgi:hypothetical protein
MEHQPPKLGIECAATDNLPVWFTYTPNLLTFSENFVSPEVAYKTRAQNKNLNIKVKIKLLQSNHARKHSRLSRYSTQATTVNFCLTLIEKSAYNTNKRMS